MDLFNSQSTFEQLVFKSNCDLDEHKMLIKDISAELAETDQQISQTRTKIENLVDALELGQPVQRLYCKGLRCWNQSSDALNSRERNLRII